MFSVLFFVVPHSIEAQNEGPFLYQLKEEISVEKYTIPKDSYIVAYQEENTYYTSIGNETINLNNLNVSKADNITEFEESIELAKKLMKSESAVDTISVDSKLNFRDVVITIENSKEFNIYYLDQDKYVIIGNLPYKIENPNEAESNTENTSSNDNQLEDSNKSNSSEITEESPNLEDTDVSKENIEVDEAKENTDSLQDKEESKDSSEKVVSSNVNQSSSSNLLMQQTNDVWSQNQANYFKVNVYSLPVYISDNNTLIKKAELRQNQVYEIQGELGNWHIIDYGEKSGYVWKESTTPYNGSLPSNSTSSTDYGNISININNNAVVYDNSNGSLEPYGMIVEGNEYSAIAKVGNWYKVNFVNRIGYVHQNGIEREFTPSDNYFKVDVYSLPVYESQNGELVKVGEMRNGEVYKRTGTAGNWHGIQFGNKTGFVWSDDTVPVSRDKAKPNSDSNNIAGTFTTTSHAVVYDNSSGEMIAIGQINQNVTYPYEIIAGNWIKVSFGNRYGYVYKEWVNFNFNSNDEYFRVENDYLPVYHNISGSLEKVGHLSINQVYQRTGSKGDWHEINFGNRTGYVWSKSTQPSSRTAAKNWNVNLKNSSSQLIASHGLKVYDNSSGMILFGRIEEGAIVPVIDKVGSWYRVLIGERIGYLYETGVSKHVYDYKTYNINFADIVNRQLSLNPQTDDHTYAYVHKDYIAKSGDTGTVSATSLHVRDIPGGNSYGKISSGTKVQIIGTSSMNNNWYKIKNPYKNYYGWMKADKDQLNYYMNPSNFKDLPAQRLQFLKLDLYTGISVKELSKTLVNKGILTGKASAFSTAARQVGINEIYLIAHALLETGNGSSPLAKGIPVMVERDKYGNPIKENGEIQIRFATSYEKPDATVYNMYGIGAYDNCAKKCGAQYAYNAGWNTVDKAIVGGAEFISEDFIKSPTYRQNTLYKMKWNPRYFVGETRSPHQYATDIGWAYKQVGRISQSYSLLDNYNLHLEIPSYK